MNSFYNEDELIKLGLASYGKNVLISKKVSIYGAKNINIGSNVRIDDFCILSGKITIGNNIHISAGVYIYSGDAGIEFKDYSCISSRSAIYAITDDYSGECMTNPMVPEKYRKVTSSSVEIGKHVVIGTGSTILPGVTIGTGAAIGAMSLVNKDIEEFTINVGIPCKKIKERSKKLLEFEKQIILEEENKDE